MNDIGSLRRRTSDSSWQWLLMGTFLGLGFAMVVCVGGYALGGINFPILENDTPTAQAQIQPNQTEVYLQMRMAQQTLEAGQQTLGDDPAGGDTAAAAQPEVTPVDTSGMPVTATPSPLPTVNNGAPADAAPGGTVLNPTATVQNQVPVQTEPIIGNTPIVGTPPAEQSTQAIGLPQAAAIPPELDVIKTDLVPITGGTYMMGTTLEEGIQAMDECGLYGKSCTDPNWVADSIPSHATTVDSFQMEVTEVTLAQYVTFLNWLGPNAHATGCQGNVCVKTRVEEPNSLIEFDGAQYTMVNPSFYANHPITYVTWWGAEEYCRTLNRRLPTEAEWERAARGSQNYVYPWGFQFDGARAMSSITANAGAVPVEEYPSGQSPYGVLNMSGNVSEWVQDWYQADYYTQAAAAGPNPQGPPSGVEHVIRGGSWDTIPLFLRAVHRMTAAPDQPSASIGFRCVTTVAGTAPVIAPAPAAGQGNGTTDTTSGAPTMAPAPTQAPPPTWTPQPTGPTATLAPG